MEENEFPTVMAGHNVEVGSEPGTHSGRIRWPEGKAFAFTVFDDPDGQPLATGKKVYALLRDLGFRTTKGVWPLAPSQPVDDTGGHCQDPEYLAWVLRLQAEGFEIGFHNAACHTSPRERTALGLDLFRDSLGHDPASMSNHYNAEEGIYFGSARLSGTNRRLYDALTLGRNRERYRGHVIDDPLFWGDLCRERIRYVRNFVFGDIDTLAACPEMPYQDPERPFVSSWFASSEGNVATSFTRQLAEDRQDALEASGGACIMYTHFGHGFCVDGRLETRFRSLMERLAAKNGWFVPVTTLLDHIRDQRGPRVLTPRDRARLERRWLRQKLRVGSR